MITMPLDKLEEFIEYFDVSIDYVLWLSNKKMNECENKFDSELLR